MKQYDSIPKWRAEDFGKPIIAFDKLDGSNIRAEWNQKQGFYKFGTRHHLIDEKNKPFGESIELIKNKFSEDLSKISEKEKWKSAVFFFEFYGPQSFAGWRAEEQHTVTLIDVNVFKKGRIPAREFLDLFGHLDIANVLFSGEFSQEFIDAVSDGSLASMTLEGVVCKHPNDASVMFKAKSRKWLDMLKQQCGDDENLFRRLS